MVHGPRAGLAALAALADDRRLAEHHRLASVRAHLHEMTGDTQAALAGYEDAGRPPRAFPSGAKEALAGYCIVDVATRERAEEIAARWPDAHHWGMEIRALMHAGAEES
ncbi:MAG: YciI family protein [Actinomycetota bacterium]|nr:YciI family protein [Actinomycetota bacterium]